MGSLSKFFVDHSDLLDEAFDLDEESNLVEKDHISAAAVEKLVHDLLVNQMQDILTELVVPYRDERSYRRLPQTGASNPDQGQWHELPPELVTQRRAATGEGPRIAGQPGRAGRAGQPGQAGQGPAASMAGGTFDQKAAGIMKNLMRDFNLQPHQAAAIVGNLGAETGGFKYQQEISPRAGRGGLGWAQWTGPRRVEFENYASANKLDPNSDDANYGFLKHELSTKYTHAIDNLRKYNDPSQIHQATQQFEGDYEQAGVKNYTSRSNFATQALNAHTAAQQNPQTPTPTGGERFDLGNRAGNLNQTLVQSVRAGSSYLPDGYSVRVTSGERPGAHVHGGGGPSQHSSGNAVDVHIVGPNGQVIPNRGEDTTGMYGTLARGSYHELLKTNPDMAGKMAWGGNFTTSASGGDKDLMHIDLGGDRGRFGSLSQQYQQHAQTDNFDARAKQATQVAQAKPSPSTSALKPPSAELATASAQPTPSDADVIAKLTAPTKVAAVTPPPVTPPPTPAVTPQSLPVSTTAPVVKPPPVPPVQTASTPPLQQAASTPVPQQPASSNTDAAAVAKLLGPQTTPLVSWSVPSRKRLGISLLRS